ncbi:putative plant organelle RNA recognition domain-containing protein [Helianthus annuus]|nr:putative plant organelle RNA recognition domain-containing protein [Helianthus annuus]
MQHRFLLRHLRHDHHHFRHYHPSTTTTSSSSVVSSINWVRDRALDHAVEKERDLKPMINLKNLINSEPSKSLPLNIISNQRSSLGIPTRPIDFIRKYPSIIQEFLPGGIGIHPHVKLTPETLALDAEEQLLFDSDIHKKDVANRLLKLLMLGRVNRIPLSVIDRLKWDLGLPNDYVETLVPEFPDYFRVVRNSNWDDLELVCWSDELAVSVMEANSVSEFPLKYSRGFEVDKKFKKWVDEWQKLPYISPYENMSSLKSEEAEKWVVGLMHEVLHILVPKKTEKDNLLVFGEYLGVRSRFKKALLEHPGIFYVSSKLRTHTVVLREGYKRDLLVERVQHPVMKLRSSYIHLMNMVKEKSKSKDAEVGEKKQKRTRDLDVDDDDDDELSDDVSEEEEDDDETEGVIDGDDDGDSESEDLEEKQRIPTKRTNLEGRKIADQRSRRRRSDDNSESEDLEEKHRIPTKRTNLEGRKIPDQRSRRRRSDDNSESEDLEEKQRIPTKRTPFEERKNPVHRSRTRRSNENRESEDLENGNTMIRGRTSRTERFNDSNRRNTSNSRVNDNDGRRGRGNDRKYALDERYSRTNRVPDRRDAKETNPRRFLRTESPAARASRDRSSERSNGSRTREGRSSEIPGVSRTREGRSSERPGVSRTREGRSSERSGASRTREGRSSERLGVSRTREGRSSERSGASRTREGRSSERSRVSRTREG